MRKNKNYHKYKKYKNKYLKLKRTDVDNESEAEIDKIDEMIWELEALSFEELDKYMTPEAYKPLYNMFSKYSKLNGDNTESLHIVEDMIYRRFVHNIAENKYSVEEISEMSKMIRKFDDFNFGKWYA
jgi:hypothetical protein